ncbi:MAG: MoaD family protein [Candidatus Aminicenantes bacterium]|nr:MoaD family protein [Candidatus Aminicenantes bacterium]
MIFILTGAVGSGKTTFLRGLVDELRASGMPLDGFLSLRVMMGGEIGGYDLFGIRDGQSQPFLRRTGPGEAQRVGPYVMLPAGLAKANEIIRRSRAGELLIVDEIGLLELEGRGFWHALKDVLFDEQRRSLVVVRESLLEQFRILFARVQVSVFEKKDWPELSNLLRGAGGFSVKIKFFAYFREMFGTKEKDLNAPPGSSLRSVLEILADTPARRAGIFAGDELQPHLVVMINGAALQASTGLETALKGGDVVAIFPLMGGG